MRIRLTRAIEFEAHHRLYDARVSEAENRARFGSTVDPHSHRYRCEVTVTGPVDERSAMVMDLPLLDRILAEEVTSRLDGVHLHRDLAAFEETLPTCEGIARDLFRRIAPRIPPPAVLARVMVAEDATLGAECLGPE